MPHGAAAGSLQKQNGSAQPVALAMSIKDTHGGGDCRMERRLILVKAI